MNVRMIPATGMITVSDMFLIIENTPGEKSAGVVPTCDEICPTCAFTASNRPDRLSMHAAARMFLSHSDICSRT